VIVELDGLGKFLARPVILLQLKVGASERAVGGYVIGIDRDRLLQTLCGAFEVILRKET
jgi:hypothetical protein